MDPIWKTIHSDREWGRYPSEPVIRFIARNYYKTDRKNTRILDFGCGQGAHTWFLAREGFDVYAFDGAESAVKKTSILLKKEGLNAYVMCRDALQVDFPDSFFDAVIDSTCICCNRSSDIEGMIANVYRMLKPNGRLLSCGFGYETTGYGTGQEIEPGTFKEIDTGILKGVGLIHFSTESEMWGVMKDCGFSSIKFDHVRYTDGDSNVEQLISYGFK